MGLISDAAALAFADGPSELPDRPNKAAIRDLFELVDLLVTAAGGILPTFNRSGSFTVTSDMAGGLVIINSSTPSQVRLPNDMIAGFNCTFVQVGTAPFEVVALSGASRAQKYNWFKSEGRFATVSAFVRGNGTGTAALWVVIGDVGP